MSPKYRKASTCILLVLLLVLSGCNKNKAEKRELVEANPLSAAYYHIEITGDNGLSELAYKSDVLNINDQTQWDGIAIIGAYGMAFQQECHSVYSPEVQAKYWRGKWVKAIATSPKEQVQRWLQEALTRNSHYDPNPIYANAVLPLGENDTRTVISITLPKIEINWEAICDANIDTYFGSQSFLTDAKTGEVTLYFTTDSGALLGVVFVADYGQTKLSGTITVSTAEGHTLKYFPDPSTLSEGTIYEEWNLVPSTTN